MRFRERLKRAIIRRLVARMPPDAHVATESPELRTRLEAVFDAPFYLAAQPDVARAGVAPLEHYLEHGWRELRDPSPAFDVSWYLSTYADVARAGVEPLSHYLQHGGAEGRRPAPNFDPDFYLSQLPDAPTGLETPLEHFLRVGAALGLRIHQVDVAQISMTRAAQIEASGWSPSQALLGLAAQTLTAHAGTEPALAALEGTLSELPFLPHTPHSLDRKWREIFQSLRSRPHVLVLVDRIDDREVSDFLDGFARAADEAGCLPNAFVLAVDEAEPSVGLDLSSDLDWMSLSEFDPPNSRETREALVAALLWSIRPPVVIAFRTEIGLHVLRRYSTQLRRHLRIVVALVSPEGSDRPAALAGALSHLEFADLVLAGSHGITEDERLTHGLPKEAATRVLPLDMEVGGGDRTWDRLAALLRVDVPPDPRSVL
ncbi:hypothetical protein [Sabulicella glaciei]|uniref:Uncharacterized protein n=1 Tax=Sabulicella glaciei TaxID=2984948 RepID=A0ABT3NZB1_9PROT|nr:hypothetical protein [Roseococcus sp. MDT2-1-1]MCW8087505.1 hypothetical protein [Roseococcus sp. MDT2-1-1]